MNILKFFRREPKPVIIQKKSTDWFPDTYLEGFSDIEKMLIMNQNTGLNWVNSNDPYIKVLIVFICQQKNATKLTEVMHYTYLRSKKGKKEKVENDPVFDLIFKRPNQLESSIAFFKFMTYQLYRNGIAYAHVIGNPPQTVISIEPLFPENVNPILGTDMLDPQIKGYNVTGKGDNIPVEQMLVFRETNPFHRIYGLTSYAPIIQDIKLLDSMNKWQKRSYEEGVHPNIIVSLDPEFGISDEKQIDDFRQSLKKKVAGPHGETIFIVSGGGKATPVKMSPVDLQMIESERQTSAMIMASYGIPMELIGLNEKNFTTAYNPAMKDWLSNRIVPMAKERIEELNNFFYTDTENELVLAEDQIPELMPTYEELEGISFMTLNEKRERVGLKRSEEPLADKLLVPASVQLLEDMKQEPDGDNL